MGWHRVLCISLFYDEELVIFPLGNKGQLAFFGIDVEDEGVQQAEMVCTPRRKRPFLGQLLQASGMNFDLEQGLGPALRRDRAPAGLLLLSASTG